VVETAKGSLESTKAQLESVKAREWSTSVSAPTTLKTLSPPPSLICSHSQSSSK
jgi:hypothetical protein